MKGKVKWYNRKKGYGFIQGDDGKDYFVHHTALPQGVEPNENDAVTFDPSQTDRGEQAQNVVLKGAEPEETVEEKTEESVEPEEKAEEPAEPEEVEEPGSEETEEPKKSEE